MSLWHQHNIILVDEYSRPWFCSKCPCMICAPRTITEFTLYGSTKGPPTDLSPWSGPGIGTPGYRWRIVNMQYDYPRSLYGSGVVADNGQLEGLPSSVSHKDRSYEQRAQIQEGCLDSYTGVFIWP